MRINKKFFDQIMQNDPAETQQDESFVDDLNDEEDKDEEREQDDLEAEDLMDLLIVKRIYRLLQLFCEGHNL